MKLYIENREDKMNVALFRHMACLLIDRFEEANEEDWQKLKLVGDFTLHNTTVKDIAGISVTIESGTEYDMRWFKVTALDSSYQLESDLMDVKTWDMVWSWMDKKPSMKAITMEGGER